MNRPATLAELRAVVWAVAAELRGASAHDGPPPQVERPKREGQGDLSTNAAMLLAPALSSAPRAIAERLRAELSERLGVDLDRTEVAGPGFVNLFLSDGWHRRAVAAMLAQGPRFGAGGAEGPERILLEFVSANPTGPLVAASGRHAAYGDALARILTHHGHEVSREYYFNDAGGQIRRLGESVHARATGAPVPEDGYQGEYVAELAAQIPGADAPGADPDHLAAQAVELLLAQIKGTLDRYGVSFDTFFSESALHAGSPSTLQQALTAVEDAGHVYRSEGAMKLRTTTFGDDKDRVVVRSNGEPTYFAADLAYMLNKRERGFKRLLSPMGADHHGYVARMQAACRAFGWADEEIEIPIIQFVHLVEGAERTAFSKRRGAFVTLDELLDEIGVDATRYFMLSRSHDRTMDLDVSLARSQSAENPVYYVQYAHARIASMLSRVGSDRVQGAIDGDWGAVALAGAERALIQKLIAFPDELAEAAERRAPHRIAGYALELAQEFTAFYRDCKVIGAEGDGVESQRLALCEAAGRIIKLSLGLLGVSAPDSM